MQITEVENLGNILCFLLSLPLPIAIIQHFFLILVMNHIKISWGQSGEPMKTTGPLTEFLNENLLTCSASGT